MSATAKHTSSTVAPSLTREDANHYVLTGGVTGTVDTTSITGRPIVSIEVDGTAVADAELRQTPLGLEVSGLVEQVPDLKTVTVTILLPTVRLQFGEQLACAGVALLTTTRTSIAPQILEGALQTYEVRPVAATASIVIS